MKPLSELLSFPTRPLFWYSYFFLFLIATFVRDEFPDITYILALAILLTVSAGLFIADDLFVASASPCFLLFFELFISGGVLSPLAPCLVIVPITPRNCTGTVRLAFMVVSLLFVAFLFFICTGTMCFPLDRSGIYFQLFHSLSVIFSVVSIGSIMSYHTSRVLDLLSAQDMYLGNASHELRAPIAIIQGVCEIQRDESVDLPQQCRSILNEVYVSAEKLERAVDSVIDYAKIYRPNQQRLVKINFDLQILLQDAKKAALLLENRSKYLHVIVETPSLEELENEDAIWISGSPSLVWDCLYNTISLFGFDSSRNVMMLKISVAKTRVFFSSICAELCVRVNSTLYTNVTGHLEMQDPVTVDKRLRIATICRIVESLNGTYNFVSAPGNGSELSFVLPLYRPTSCGSPTEVSGLGVSYLEGRYIERLCLAEGKVGTVELSEKASRASNRTNGSLTKHVLVVDDSAVMRKIVESKLQKNGYICFQASDGQEAANMYLQCLPLRAIIMDYHMSGCDGLKGSMMIRRLEESSSVPRVPIILASAEFDDISWKDHGFERFGIDICIGKPLRFLALLKILEDAI
tara:strand:- start:1701 stop:3434 length:1734 start_codon:yes stop_codon:yes gene_type:complete